VTLFVTLERTGDSEHVQLHLTCPRLRLNREPLPPLPLTTVSIEALRQAVIEALAGSGDAPPADARSIAMTTGAALYDRLMPPEHPLRASYLRLREWPSRTKPLSWLIISEERCVLPWELVAAWGYEAEGEPPWYDEPLGRHFVITHWIGRQGLRLPGEAPLGMVGVAHYGQRPTELRRWQASLGGETWATVAEEPLQGGLLQRGSPFFGLHLVRYTDDRGDTRIAEANVSPNELAFGRRAERISKDARLDLTLRRPIVSLSFVDGDGTTDEHDTELERVWTTPLLQAGVTAAIGARWTTSPEADRTFFGAMYAALREGVSLGAAVWHARQHTRDLHPHRNDWLAYTCFGHTTCEPYTVEQSEGFTYFEATDVLESDSFAAGATYRFRACVSDAPPSWYDGRRHVHQIPAEDEDVSVTVVNLATGAAETHTLEPVPGTADRDHVLDLRMPDEPATVPFYVRFARGGRELRTSVLELTVV
jgi:hypothetical protein